MNIFIVDLDPKEAARSLCDKHIVKMPLESAQMLCHAAYKLGNPSLNKPPYEDLPKKYHRHPCTLWILESKQNYLWTCEHALELCKEYTARYDKIHKCQAVIEWCINHVPERLPNIGLTPFATAIKKDLYSHLIVPEDPVTTYRKFYIADKASFAKWKRNKPSWYTI